MGFNDPRLWMRPVRAATTGDRVASITNSADDLVSRSTLWNGEVPLRNRRERHGENTLNPVRNVLHEDGEDQDSGHEPDGTGDLF